MSQLMTPKEVAELLQVTEGTVRKWVFFNKIPYVKLNKSIRFTRAQIDKFIEKRSIPARVLLIK